MKTKNSSTQQAVCTIYKMPLNHTSKYSELTDEQFLLIGKIVIEFSNLEFLLGVLLSRLLITPEFLGRTYTDQMNAFSILEAIDNALEIHCRRYSYKIITEQNVLQIKIILQDIKTFRPLRNKFAHFCWSRSNDNEIFGTKLSGKLPNTKKNVESVLIKNSDIMDSYIKVYSTVEKLQQLIYLLPELPEDRGLLDKLVIRKNCT